MSAGIAAPPPPRSRPPLARLPAGSGRILLWLLLALALTAALYTAAPFLLPTRIREGPMVQLPAEDTVTLVWYTTRTVDCDLRIHLGDVDRTVPVTRLGRRHVARVDGLEPASSYAYSIHTGNRVLLDGVSFQTNRPAGARYSFLVLGDTGRGGRTQFDVARQMLAVHPAADFVLHTGDVVYPDGARRRYEARFFAPYRDILAHIPFWPSLGNHDVRRETDSSFSAAPYLEVFTLPENGPPELPVEMNYWFDYADCRIAVVDSNLSDVLLSEVIAPWLREVLAEEGPRWRFVVMHHPPYTAGRYGQDVRLQQALVPVFDDVGVDIVFTGHDHNYQRIGPMRGGEPVDDGTLYIISGAGGARLYKIRQPGLVGLQTATDSVHSFTQVVVDGDALTLRQIDRYGRTLDEHHVTQRIESAAP